MMNSPNYLAEQAKSMLSEFELSVVQSLLEITRSVFPNSDLFVVKNSEKGKPVIRIGANFRKFDDKSKNRVVLSVGPPKNGKGPTLSWGGQGTNRSEALESKIYKLKGVKKVFGTMKGIELGKINSVTKKRYLEFLQKHKNEPLLLQSFNGNSICEISFESLSQKSISSTPKSVIRKPTELEIEAWLNEITIIQKPLVSYLKKSEILHGYQVKDEEPLDIGRIDIFLCPNKKSTKLPQVLMELKFLGNGEPNSVNRSKIRLAFGQLLDYSVHLAKQYSNNTLERWLIVNSIPSEYLDFLKKLAEIDPKFSVWTFNTQEKVPLTKHIGKSAFVFN